MNMLSDVIEHEIFCVCIFNGHEVAWEICDSNDTILDLKRLFRKKYNILNCKMYYFYRREYDVYDDDHLIDFLEKDKINALTFKIYTDDKYSIPK